MKIKLASLIAMAGLALAAFEVQASSLVEGSIEDGKAKSITCAACHGPEGNSANPLWPNLAGQKEAYLVAQLKAFRDGSRANAAGAGVQQHRRRLPPGAGGAGRGACCCCSARVWRAGVRRGRRPA